MSFSQRINDSVHELRRGQRTVSFENIQKTMYIRFETAKCETNNPIQIYLIMDDS